MRFATFFPFQTRNENPVIPYKNPDPPNAMSADTGNAGLDGYSTLSRANRYNGERPAIGGVPDYPFPHNTTED